jgi:hypothetical protein
VACHGDRQLLLAHEHAAQLLLLQEIELLVRVRAQQDLDRRVQGDRNDRALELQDL